jgi:acetolactate synthase-1/2/3 large subunit
MEALSLDALAPEAALESPMNTEGLQRSPAQGPTSPKRPRTIADRPCSCPGEAQTKVETPRTGAEVVLDTLLECGVDTVFGYPGGAALPLYDALYSRPQLRHVLVRHEQAAVHAAEGYARSTGRIGVVLVTSGPGVANTISGLLDAVSDSVPILCISGQVSTAVIGTQAFQESDALGMSRPVTKWNCQPHDASSLDEVVREAVTIALSGRPGPVLLDLPKDVQLQSARAGCAVPPARPARSGHAGDLGRPGHPEYPEHTVRSVHTGHSARGGQATHRKTAPLGLAVSDLSARPRLEQAAELIAAASRPVLYGGGGLVSSGAAACAAFTCLARSRNIPTTLTLMGLGALPGSDPNFLGMLGMHGTVEANLAMHHADLVICVGARFDDRITGRLSDFCPGARKIHIDIDPGNIGRIVPVDVALPGDCGAVLSALIELLPVPSRGALDCWWEMIAKWRGADCLAFERDERVILPQHLLACVQEHLQGRDAIVSTDVGQHQMWAAQYLRFEQPRRWLSSGGAGTMGFGLPAAIGAQVAHPDKTVVCVSGDASILMNIQELSTAIQHETPVKVILSNNGYMGMVRQWQQLNHGNRLSHSWNAALPDFVALARAFGWGARRVGKPSELAEGIAECLAWDGPFFLDVQVAPQENCYPMIPAGRGHQEIMLADGVWYRDS